MHAAIVIATPGQHDDRNVAGGLAILECLADFEAVNAGQHDIADDDVGNLVGRNAHALLPVRRDLAVVRIRKQGHQVLRDSEHQLPSIAHCGTYCKIVDFGQRDNGVLQIMAEGEVKYVVRDQYQSQDNLMLARVEFLPLEDQDNVPRHKQHLVEILKTLNAHESIKALGLDINYKLASDVGARLTELLPAVSNDFKQRMLEMNNPWLRLSELEKQLLRMQDSQR